MTSKQMTLDEAQAIVDRKCVEPGCWHHREQGYVYCQCCLTHRCLVIPQERRGRFQEAGKLLSAKSQI